jgi:hypothetical protein
MLKNISLEIGKQFMHDVEKFQHISRRSAPMHLRRRRLCVLRFLFTQAYFNIVVIYILSAAEKKESQTSLRMKRFEIFLGHFEEYFSL